jgi:hypothetical protein
LSPTVIPPKRRSFWNVRATPRRVTWSGRSPVIERPSSRTSPASGREKPVMTSKRADFPAPFGPMTPTISPAATAKLMSALATTPPKRFVTWTTSTSGGAPAPGSAPAAGAVSA